MVTFNEQLIINTTKYLNNTPSFFSNKLPENAQFLKDHFYDDTEGKLYIIELVRRIGIRIQFDHEINLKEMDSSHRVSRNMPDYQDELVKAFINFIYTNELREFLLDRVTEENASVVLSLADTFKDEKLKRRCELKLNII